jgi:hypothetical protein
MFVSPQIQKLAQKKHNIKVGPSTKIMGPG